MLDMLAVALMVALTVKPRRPGVDSDDVVMSFKEAIAKPHNKVYVDHIRAVEKKWGIPENLLLRLAYEESRFRPDVVFGKKDSEKGAIGMFQMLPRFFGKRETLADWRKAAELAAAYLVKMRREFGKWEYAIKGYHCGETDMRKMRNGVLKTGCAGPKTADYWIKISQDVPVL